ncbi:MAG: 2-oxoacid:acceptor oxidoreductase [Nitrospirae bacterium]|nr:MAG: 2-oxoacid:acceptor oxidoreductase [Nitrospirota bacterium]
MLQVRIHGRGGQGVVTAAELLSIAVFLDGKYALAFPSFGSERTGAPVAAFCRIADRPIRTREPVIHPDVVIVQDSTLLYHVDVFGGLHPEGYLIINSSRTAPELGIEERCASLPDGHWCIFPATEIALKHLHRPVPNSALLAGFAALTQSVSLSSILRAIQERFPGALGTQNMEVAKEAFGVVRERLGRTDSTAAGEPLAAPA